MPRKISQVTVRNRMTEVPICKTVGLAYVGSNPTPATSESAGQTGPVGRVSCVEGASGIIARRAGRSCAGHGLGWSASCRRGSGLGSVAVLLLRVVDRWLASRLVGLGLPGHGAMGHRQAVSDFFRPWQSWVCG